MAGLFQVTRPRPRPRPAHLDIDEEKDLGLLINSDLCGVILMGDTSKPLDEKERLLVKYGKKCWKL